ncbi:MAG: hypothetical protein PHT99_07185 [Methanoregula sp.]|nr:hypothetical protein [Methanoregula sp.]
MGIPVVILLLVAGVFFAGCSDSSTTTRETTALSGVTTTVAPATALYSAGDIVKNPKSTAKTGLLIIGYDAGTDMYERAYIYPNSDGSWGYRLDSKTAKVSRPTIETVYTEKVHTVAVSAVPIGTPTTAATATATYATKTTTVTTTATATTTSALAPEVKDITPYYGKTGTTVSITELKGKNFVSGANVTLVKSGESDITATDVSVSSSILITCKFAIPSDADLGFWDVVVTNPDKHYSRYQNGFNIIQGSTSVTTTTTSTTGTAVSGLVTVYSASPSIVTTGGGAGSEMIMVTGTNLTSGANLKLVSSSRTLTGTGYYLPNTQQATARFDIPAGSSGTYTISVVDSSGNILGSLANGLVIQ